MKPNKQQYIDFIVNELRKGNVLYKDVSCVFLPKFALTRQSFDKYWKLANEAHREAQEAIKSTQEIQTITNELDKLKKANLTKVDRILIAESIALNEDGTANNADKLKALDYLAKIEGDYATTKQDLTIIDKTGAGSLFIEK
jgi:hypothetical protein